MGVQPAGCGKLMQFCVRYCGVYSYLYMTMLVYVYSLCYYIYDLVVNY